MMTTDRINAKAFQEIIAYYLYERLFEKILKLRSVSSQTVYLGL